MKKEQCDIIIVGGGTGGLALAAALSGKGYRILILEKESTPRPDRRGEIIQPNGLAVLDRLGVLHTLITRSSPLPLWQFYAADDELLTTRDYRMLPPPYNYSLGTVSSDTKKALLEKVQKDSRCELRAGVGVRGLLREGQRVSGIVVTHKGEDAEITSRVIIGADGAHSLIRQELKIPCRIKTYHDAYLTMLIPRPPDYPNQGRAYWGRGVYLGVLPVSVSRLYLFYFLREEDYPRFEKGGLDVVRRAIASLVPSLSGPLGALSRWDEVLLWRTFSVTCETWVVDGGVLMGDAAHAISPHTAQGTNQALSDALMLADVLQDCFRQGDFSRRSLASYEEARRPHVEFLQKLGEELGIFFATTNPFLGWLRNRALRLSNRDHALRYKDIAMISGLQHKGYTLSDRLRLIGLLPGRP